MLAAFLMIGLFSYTPAAMSNLLTAGLLPNADDYWANFDQSAIDKYTQMIIAVSWNSLAWAIPTIVLSAGQAGAHLGESLSYNRASIEKNLRGRQAGRFLSLLVAAGSAAVPVSIFYSGIQGDYQSGLVTNPDEYNRRMYTQLGLIGLFTIVQNYPSFSQLTERTFNFFGKGATPEVQTSRQNLVELFQKAAHHAYQLDDEATANAYTTFTAAADPLSQLNFLAFLGEADGDAASHTSAISCGDKVLYGIAGTLGVCNATMRSWLIQSSLQTLSQTYMPYDASMGLSITGAAIFGTAYTGKTFFNTKQYLETTLDLCKLSSKPNSETSYKWSKRALFIACNLEGLVYSAPAGIAAWMILDAVGASTAVQGVTLGIFGLDAIMENTMGFWDNRFQHLPQIAVDACYTVKDKAVQAKNWLWGKLGYTTSTVNPAGQRPAPIQREASALLDTPSRQRDALIKAAEAMEKVARKLPDNKVLALTAYFQREQV